MNRYSEHTVELMNRKSIVIVIITVLIGAFLSGCIDSTKTEVKTAPTAVSVKEPEGTIRVSGAFALFPMMQKWGDEYKKLHPKVNFDISAGGAGRGIGDAASIMFTTGYTERIPTSVFDAAASLPLAIFFLLNSPQEEVRQKAYASAVILLLIILAISIILSRKYTKYIIK